jgi:hypothetical protein
MIKTSKMEPVRRRLFGSDEPQYVRTFRSTLSKLTVLNYGKLVVQLLNIDVLPEDPKDLSSEKVQEMRITDTKAMNDIAKIFINQVKISFKTDKNLKNENREVKTAYGEDSVLLYANLATDLKNKWSGRQGRVFFECLLVEIVKFFNQHYENPGPDNLDRNSVIRFVSFLCMNDKKPIPVLFALKICETFDRLNVNDVGLRIKFFTYLLPMFRDNNIFKATYEKKYLDFFRSVAEDKISEIKEKSLVFKCKDDILSRWN